LEDDEQTGRQTTVRTELKMLANVFQMADEVAATVVAEGISHVLATKFCPIS
jgi:hypothetical protein